MENESTVKYGFMREEIISVLSRYVTNDRLEEFVKEHPVQIADLQKGRISGVFKGFQKKGNPDETYDARISLKRQKEESSERMFIIPTFTFKNKILNIPKAITMDGVQVQFTEQQYNELVQTGRLSETLKFTGQSGINREMFLAVDRELNRIAWVPAAFFRVPDSLYQTELSQEQKEYLTAGKKARIEIEFKGGKQIVSAYYDPVLHKIRFEPVNGQDAVERTKEKRENVKPEQSEKKKPTRKLEGKQKQQTKTKTVGKTRSTGIN
jgi:hypothetical protein